MARENGDVLRDPVTRDEVIKLLLRIEHAAEEYDGGACREMIDRLRAEQEVAEHVGEPDTFQAPAVATGSGALAISQPLKAATAEMERLVGELKAKEDETQAVIRAAQVEANRKAREELSQRITAARHALEQILGDIEVATGERPIAPHHSTWHTLVDNGGMAEFFKEWKQWGDRVVGICKNGLGRLSRSGM